MWYILLLIYQRTIPSAINLIYADGDPKVWKEVLDTNLYGVALCSHAAVKQMRETDVSGHIVNINSIAGHKVVNMSPNDYNMYAPSKHGVTAFTEVLRQELIHFKTKIKVSVSYNTY